MRAALQGRAAALPNIKATLNIADAGVWLAIAFFAIAGVYASAGQAGASGYLAAMALFGVAPEVMKPTALALNVLVAAIATFQFWRAGLLSWRTFYPFAILGFPFSVLGGALDLPVHVYNPLVASALLFSAVQILRARDGSETEPQAPPFLPSLLTGGAVGFVSGAAGTGGGVFLAPIILFMNWTSVRKTAAVTAVYNLLNSAAALIGAHATLVRLPAALPCWLLAAGLGGVIGTVVGSNYLSDLALRRVMASVLLVSAAKLLIW